MSNFALVCWLDVFDLAASLRSHAGLFEPGEAGRRVLPVRSHREDGKFVAHFATQKWPELANVRSRIKRFGDQALGGVEFGDIFLEMLDPGATLPWETRAADYQRAHLPLRTNPASTLFAGTEGLSPAQGWLTVVAGHVPNSAVNLGETPRVHLIVDFRKKEAA